MVGGGRAGGDDRGSVGSASHGDVCGDCGGVGCRAAVVRR